MDSDSHFQKKEPDKQPIVRALLLNIIINLFNFVILRLLDLSALFWSVTEKWNRPTPPFGFNPSIWCLGQRGSLHSTTNRCCGDACCVRQFLGHDSTLLWRWSQSMAHITTTRPSITWICRSIRDLSSESDIMHATGERNCMRSSNTRARPQMCKRNGSGAAGCPQRETSGQLSRSASGRSGPISRTPDLTCVSCGAHTRTWHNWRRFLLCWGVRCPQGSSLEGLLPLPPHTCIPTTLTRFHRAAAHCAANNLFF